MVSRDLLRLPKLALYFFALIAFVRTTVASSSLRALHLSDGRHHRVLLPNGEKPYTSVSLQTGAGGCSGSQEAVLDIYRGPSGGNPTVLHLPGGAYMNLVEDTVNVAGSQYLDAGYTLAVLYYRLPRSPTDRPWLVCSNPQEALDDLAAAIRILRENAEEYHVDPSAVVAAGFSAGGHLAALYAMRCVGPSSCPNAMVLHFPFLETGAKIFCTTIGGAFANSGLYESCFPTALVDGAAPPTVLYHANGDTVVPTQEIIDFRESLSNQGVPNEYYEVPRGGHYLVPFDQVADVSGGVFRDGDDYSSLVARALALPPPSCTRCDDEVPNFMTQNGQTCESGTWAIANKCNSDAFWTARGYCRNSCHKAERGYEGDNCCLSQESCISCSDVPSPWMEGKDHTCEEGRWYIRNNCNTNASWEENVYCRQSCFSAGLGYDGDICCE